MEKSRKIATLFLIIASLALVSVVSRGKSSQEDITTGQVVVSGTWGKEPGQFGLKEEKEEVVFHLGPQSFTVDGEGNIYVADTENYRIQKFDSKGNLILCFGSKGRKDDQFWLIMDVAADNEGNIYVADYKNDSVKIFDNQGRYLTKIMTSKLDPKHPWEGPKVVKIDAEGNLYIECDFPRAYKFNRKKELLTILDSRLKVIAGKSYDISSRKKSKEVSVKIYNLVNNERKKLIKSFTFRADVFYPLAMFRGVDRWNNIYIIYPGSEPGALVRIARINEMGELLNTYKVELRLYHRGGILIRSTKNGDIYIMNSTKDKFWIEKIPYRHH